MGFREIDWQRGWRRTYSMEGGVEAYAIEGG